MLLLYIRHGDPVYNPDSLTPLGARQAEAVAKRVALYGADTIYASSSGRAKLTAQPTCELLKKEMKVLDWCNEGYAWDEFSLVSERTGERHWDFHQSEIREVYASRESFELGERWYDHPALANHRDRFKAGEDRIRRETHGLLAAHGYVYDPEKRMYRAERPNEERIAVFAHQGFGLTFLSCLLDIPHPTFTTKFDMGHTGMTVIHFETDAEFVLPRVLTLSDDSHIYREGLPTAYQNTIRF